jgi:hypothetical protein
MHSVKRETLSFKRSPDWFIEAKWLYLMATQATKTHSVLMVVEYVNNYSVRFCSLWAKVLINRGDIIPD